MLMKFVTWLACSLGGWLIPPKTATGSLLDEWASALTVSRMYFGDGESDKPDDYCFWDDSQFLVGWYESDDHLRERFFDEVNLNRERQN